MKTVNLPSAQPEDAPWRALLRPEIRDFIRTHDQDDVAALALRKPPAPDWPYALILDQIRARQKAAVKMPGWLERAVIFPAPAIIEQASSEATAHYKAGLVGSSTFVDLTGGCGVDACAMLEKFASGIICEADPQAAALLAYNLEILHEKKIEVRAGRAEDLIDDLPRVDVICIDPQRRNDNRKGLFRLADCAPDVTALLPLLHEKAAIVILKTSPMLDIAQGISELENVAQVHVLEWSGECKEIVYVIDFSTNLDAGDIPVTAAMLDAFGAAAARHVFTRTAEEHTEPRLSAPRRYVYEPGPAFQKAGGFKTLAAATGTYKLHPHTHLYTADEPAPGFPGRGFEILEILPVRAKKNLPACANLALRNFPGTTEELRRRLGLKDGGEDYLFACTLQAGDRALLRCRKIS